MALTFTPSPEIGKPCPPFQLKSTEGQTVDLKSISSPVLVVMFICNHCPYVKAIEDRLLSLARSFDPRLVQFLAICSNDPTEYEEDSFENLKKRAREKDYPFPYLHDATQEVARAFDAVCTPDFFVFNRLRKLTYRGRLDDNWKDASKVKVEDLKGAIQTTLQGTALVGEQFPSMGCSIKWIGERA